MEEKGEGKAVVGQSQAERGVKIEPMRSVSMLRIWKSCCHCMMTIVSQDGQAIRTMLQSRQSKYLMRL